MLLSWVLLLGLLALLLGLLFHRPGADPAWAARTTTCTDDAALCGTRVMDWRRAASDRPATRFCSCCCRRPRARSATGPRPLLALQQPHTQHVRPRATAGRSQLTAAGPLVVCEIVLQLCGGCTRVHSGVPASGAPT